jgi:hypothetical protein
MSTEAIIKKLASELESGIATEPQVVYLLAALRKLMERDGLKEQYKYLTFHCDWALHHKLRGATAQDILREFDTAHLLLKEGQIDLHDLPLDLEKQVMGISAMRFFEVEMSAVLQHYGLPSVNRKKYSEGWAHFLYLYSRVIEDISLEVNDAVANHADHISQVVVHVDTAVIENGAHLLFRVTWRLHDRNGRTGSIFVINSYARDEE